MLLIPSLLGTKVKKKKYKNNISNSSMYNLSLKKLPV